MKKIIFFGLLISLNICGGSVVAAQAKMHVYSDVVHDTAMFEMFQKIKDHVSVLIEAKIFNSKKGAIDWQCYHDHERTEQGFVLEVFEGTLLNGVVYGISNRFITPWGTFILKNKENKSFFDYKISLKEQCDVKYIGNRWLDGEMPSQLYEILSIDDMQLPSVIWPKIDYSHWEAYEALRNKQEENGKWLAGPGGPEKDK